MIVAMMIAMVSIAIVVAIVFVGTLVVVAMIGCDDAAGRDEKKS
jgi:ABC-type Mn2+/Zn2+ transport system permease subunit